MASSGRVQSFKNLRPGVRARGKRDTLACGRGQSHQIVAASKASPHARQPVESGRADIDGANPVQG